MPAVSGLATGIAIIVIAAVLELPWLLSPALIVSLAGWLAVAIRDRGCAV
jgi:hypothetical protein